MIVQKLEEQALYTIQQQKEIQQLKEKNQAIIQELQALKQQNKAS